MTTRYAWNLADPSGPGNDIIDITPDDNNDLQTTVGEDTVVGVRALHAASAGTIRVKMASGHLVTLDFAAGETRIGQFLRVLDTGTTVSTDSAGEGIEGHL